MLKLKKLSIPGTILIPAFIVWLGLVAIKYYQQHPSFYQALKGLGEILSIFFFLSIILLTAFLGGHSLLKLFKIELTGLERFLFSMGLGFGVLIYSTFFLGAVGLLYTPVIWGVMASIILLSMLSMLNMLSILSIKNIKKFPQRQKKKPVVKERNFSWFDLSLIVIFFVTLLVVLISVLTPNIAWDCAVYHLNVPKIYLKAHKFIFIPHNISSNMPLNIEMLYTIALVVKGPIVAKLLSFTFGLLTLLGIYSFGKRHFNPQIALWAAVVFYLNPVTLFVADISYIDLGVTYYFLLAWYGFFLWLNPKNQDSKNYDSKNDRWLILMAIFCGIIMGAKYTTVFGTFVLGAGILLKLYFSKKLSFFQMSKKASLFTFISLILVIPWLIKSYLFTGNPFYPMLYNLFGGVDWDKELAQQFVSWQMSKKGGTDILGYIFLPWQMTIHGNYGQIFDGILSPLYLIFIPFLLFLKERSKIIIYLLILSLGFFVLWSLSIQVLRYLLPILPMWSIIVSYVIKSLCLQNKGFKIAVWSAVLIILLSIQLPYIFEHSTDLPAAVGLESKDSYLGRTFHSYDTFKYINEKLDKNAKILFLWENRGFHCEREYLADSFFEVSQMLKMIRECGSAPKLYQKLKELKVTHILLNKNLAAVFYDRKGNELPIIEQFLSQYTKQIYSQNNVDLFEMKEAP